MEIETSQMWGMRTETIPVIIGALGSYQAKNWLSPSAPGPWFGLGPRDSKQTLREDDNNNNNNNGYPSTKATRQVN